MPALPPLNQDFVVLHDALDIYVTHYFAIFVLVRQVSAMEYSIAIRFLTKKKPVYPADGTIPRLRPSMVFVVGNDPFLRKKVSQFGL